MWSSCYACYHLDPTQLQACSHQRGRALNCIKRIEKKNIHVSHSGHLDLTLKTVREDSEKAKRKRMNASLSCCCDLLSYLLTCEIPVLVQTEMSERLFDRLAWFRHLYSSKDGL